MELGFLYYFTNGVGIVLKLKEKRGTLKLLISSKLGIRKIDMEGIYRADWNVNIKYLQCFK